MKKVTGLGGIFFKCSDPVKIRSWYQEHLGIDSNEYGGVFQWIDKDDKEKLCNTAWSPMGDKTKYFDPSDKPYMINYRVENLTALLKELKAQGVVMAGEPQEFEYGKFAWIMDPDGNKIELWEPVDEKL